MSFLYWIHNKEHTDVCSQGYVGVATDWPRRVRQHRHKFKSIWQDVQMEKLVEADSKYCYDLEKKLRPHRNIGWNLAAGGYRNNVMFGDENPNKGKFGVNAPRFIGWYITPLGRFERPEDAAKAHNCAMTTIARRCKGRWVSGTYLHPHSGYAFEQKA